MKDNTRIAIGYFCIALVFISWSLMIGWLGTPTAFTFRIEMDNNTKDAFQSINYSAIEAIENNQDYNNALLFQPLNDTNYASLMIHEPTEHEPVMTFFSSNNTEILKILNNGSVYHMGKYVGDNESLPNLLTEAFAVYTKGVKDE